MTRNYYENSMEHLADELERIDLRLGNQYLKVKHHFENKGEFHGLYISDDEVVSFLKDSRSRYVWSDPDPGSEPSDFVLSGLRIGEKIQESRKRGIVLGLDHLAVAFGLTRSDLDILVLCMAPELNSGYERVFAYLQDDMTRRKPSVGLVMDILGPTFQERMTVRGRLTKKSPLVGKRLIHVAADPSFPESPFVSRCLHVDERIAAWLLEGLFETGFPDMDMASEWRLVHPVMNYESLILSESLKQEIRIVSERHRQGKATVLYFCGAHGTGRQSAAQAVCVNMNRSLLVADLERMVQDHADPRPVFRNAIREADLMNALICWSKADILFADEKRPVLEELMDMIEHQGALCFWTGRVSWEPGNLTGQRVFVSFEFPVPCYEQRLVLWKTRMACENTGREVDPEPLAAAFAFSGGQIRDAVLSAKNHALKNGTGAVTDAGFRAACLLQSSRKLSDLARQIRPVCTWGDIVLPEDRLEQLKEIVSHARYRSFVFDTWGFGRKLSYGKGLNVLFSGPSGTGKTMAAEIMASDLGLHLYKIDLARLVSKYIGETEKNLAVIFTEAETSNAILFFDEADAIFGRRSEVHDAHDRYANIETSYLLQKMEEYEGITILATNFKRNMDEAFVRRIHHSVDFPLPEKHHRCEIWRKTWPEKLPLAEDIDFDSLSGRFELSGGNIRNICLSAAFIAAADGKTVTMNHLVRATRSEYRKMGKLMMGGEFPELMSLMNQPDAVKAGASIQEDER